MIKKSKTSWGKVAFWYDKHLEKNDDTYHLKVIYPNLLRILGNIKGEKILDLACGQGQFSRILSKENALVFGVDIGNELIEIAKNKNKDLENKINYFKGSADDLFMFKRDYFDKVVCVLALQNIENLQKIFEEVSRILKKGGNFIFVINHPSFRNPKNTHWEYDNKNNIQYRRIDEYMSESKTKIDMTPGSSKDKKFTISFHRPFQVYAKSLFKNGFLINHFEEWNSHKISEKGKREKAENKSRKEIPLFMCISVSKI